MHIMKVQRGCRRSSTPSSPHWKDVSGHLYCPAALSQGKAPESSIRSALSVKKKRVPPPAGNRNTIPRCLATYLVTQPLCIRKFIIRIRNRIRMLKILSASAGRNYSQTCLTRSWRDRQKKKKNRIIQEFEIVKLCSKYIIVKGPIKNFELFTNSNYASSN
jgi:hypothetical protein